jgi:hypothetical protein
VASQEGLGFVSKYIDRITWVVVTLSYGRGEELQLCLGQYEQLVGIVRNAP